MTIAIIPLTGIPEIRRGDDIATSILEAAASAHLALIDDDIVVVTHKVVSKAEGATAELSESDHEAYRSLVESEAVEVIRRRGGVIGEALRQL